MENRFKVFETPLPGLLVIQGSKYIDSRGSFARKYCSRDFSDLRLNSDWHQINLSSNTSKGTFRGLHYQKEPFAETKLITCVKGSILDIAVDIREDSPTYTKYFYLEMYERDELAFYIPNGFAHGYQTLENGTDVMYLSSNFFDAESECGIRFDDPLIDINLPIPISNISAKDSSWPLL